MLPDITQTVLHHIQTEISPSAKMVDLGDPSIWWPRALKPSNGEWWFSGGDTFIDIPGGIIIRIIGTNITIHNTNARGWFTTEQLDKAPQIDLTNPNSLDQLTEAITPFWLKNPI